MDRDFEFGEMLAAAGVIPVIAIDDVERAGPLVKALARGGLWVVEVVLRTPSALDCIAAMRSASPDSIVGAGTVRSLSDLDRSIAAGAAFAVSPGFSPVLLDAARERELPYLPAVSTPAETLQVLERGYDLLKFFPAELFGGPAMLSALRGPFPNARFCCTGGIGISRLAAYRAEPNVIAVGASFMVPQPAIDEEAWDIIEGLARDARASWTQGQQTAVTRAPVRRKQITKAPISRSTPITMVPRIRRA